MAYTTTDAVIAKIKVNNVDHVLDAKYLNGLTGEE